MIITHGNLIITHGNLIIGDLSLTIVTCIHQSMSKQSNSPSPSGEVRWGLMFIGLIDLLKSLTKQSNLFLPLGKGWMGLEVRWGAEMID